MIRIVIVGAGFAGMAAALGLEKQFRGNQDMKITLIDNRDYLLMPENLYKVATCQEESASITDLRKKAGIPLKEIVGLRRICLKKAKAASIDLRARTVLAGIERVSFDYLILATGSAADFSGVSGAEKFAMPLKTFTDALAIRNRLEFVFQEQLLNFKKGRIRLVVVGGGVSGCELAVELSGFVKILCRKYKYPPDKTELNIIEANNRLISELPIKISRQIFYRLNKLGVKVLLSLPVASVDGHFINFYSGEKLEYGALFWAAGARAAGLPGLESLSRDNKGRIKVNQFLQAENYDRLFAIGDAAANFNDEDGILSGSMVKAIRQGEYVAKALPKILKNQRPLPSQFQYPGFQMSLGGQWAIFSRKPFYFTGRPAYFLKVARNFRTYVFIIGFWQAVKYFIFK